MRAETTEWGQLFLRYAELGPQAAPDALAQARPPIETTVPLSSRVH